MCIRWLLELRGLDIQSTWKYFIRRVQAYCGIIGNQMANVIAIWPDQEHGRRWVRLRAAIISARVSGLMARTQRQTQMKAGAVRFATANVLKMLPTDEGDGWFGIWRAQLDASFHELGLDSIGVEEAGGRCSAFRRRKNVIQATKAPLEQSSGCAILWCQR